MRLQPQGDKIPLLIDSGASVNLLKKSVCPSELLKQLIRKDVTIKGITPIPMKVLGSCRVTYYLNEHPLIDDAYIIPDGETAIATSGILSRNFLQKNKIYLRGENDTVLFKGQLYDLMSYTDLGVLKQQRKTESDKSEEKSSDLSAFNYQSDSPKNTQVSKKKLITNIRDNGSMEYKDSTDTTPSPLIDIVLEDIPVVLKTNILLPSETSTQFNITLKQPLYGEYIFIPSKQNMTDWDLYAFMTTHSFNGDNIMIASICNFSTKDKILMKNIQIGYLVRNVPENIEKLFQSSEDALSHEVFSADFKISEILEDETDLSALQKRIPKDRDVSKMIEKGNMTDGQYRRLQRLVRQYKEIFWLPGDILSKTDKVTARIDTGDAPPVSVKPYRPPPALIPQMKTEIDDLLKQGIIVPSDNSPWNAPALLISKKKDGVTKARLVVDYRSINKLISPISVNFPDVFHSIIKSAGATYFSSLDLIKAFHQIPLHEDDIPKTSFACPFGTFSYTRLPFGLKTSPLIFQQLMDKVLTAKTDNFSSVFLDDLLVYTKGNSKDHLRKLEIVFSLLKEANLKLRIDKCEFFKTETKYLGFRINKKGYFPDHAKIEIVKAFPRPSTTTQVKSFLGLVGFFRKHDPLFAETAAPLTRLTSPKIRFKWTEECEKAFIELKRHICQQALLSFPKYGEEPFLVYCDASNQALGAVLAQKQDNEIVPISFTSRILSDTEKRYPTFRREILALIFAIKQFKYYLTNQHFKVFTDHKPLTYVLTSKNLKSVLERYALLLSEYSFEILYLPGSQNTAADAMSRLSVQDGKVDYLPDETGIPYKTYQEFLEYWQNKQKSVEIETVPTKAELRKMKQLKPRVEQATLKPINVSQETQEPKIEAFMDTQLDSEPCEQPQKSFPEIQALARFLHLKNKLDQLRQRVHEFDSTSSNETSQIALDEELTKILLDIDEVNTLQEPHLRMKRKDLVDLTYAVIQELEGKIDYTPTDRSIDLSPSTDSLPLPPNTDNEDTNVSEDLPYDPETPANFSEPNLTTESYDTCTSFVSNSDSNDMEIRCNISNITSSTGTTSLEDSLSTPQTIEEEKDEEDIDGLSFSRLETQENSKDISTGTQALNIISTMEKSIKLIGEKLQPTTTTLPFDFIPRSTILNAQKADQYCKDIISEFTKEGEKQGGKGFIIDDDQLLFKLNKRNRPVAYIPQSIESQLIKTFHESSFTGHAGLAKLIPLMQSSVYIKDLRKKATEILAQCIDCKQTKPFNKPIKAPMQLYTLPRAPMEEINMDLFGPIYTPNDPLNLKYALVIVDRFSHYVECFPIPDMTSFTILNTLLEKFIPAHGMPRKITTDRQSSLVSAEFIDFCTRLHIKHRPTTAYNPRSNGLAEAHVKKVKQIINTLAHDKPDIPWYSYLHFALIAIRNTVNMSTGRTPFEVLYGRPMRTPLISQLEYSKYKLDDEANIDFRLALFQNIWTEVGKHLQGYQEKYQKKQNENTRHYNFRQGQHVLLKTAQFNPDFSKIYQTKFQGLYKIIGLRTATATIQQVKDPTIIKTVHINRLRPMSINKNDTDEPVQDETTEEASTKRTKQHAPARPSTPRPTEITVDPEHESSSSGNSLIPTHKYNTRSKKNKTFTNLVNAVRKYFVKPATPTNSSSSSLASPQLSALD